MTKKLFLLLMFFLPIHAIMALSQIEKLNQFLSHDLKLENDELDIAAKKLVPFFETIPSPLMDDFILLAQEVTLTPLFKQNFALIGENDATIAAAEGHRLIYENEFLRIVESRLKPGQLVPFHTHQWDSIILTLQGSKFRCDDGTNVTLEEWTSMAGKVEGSFHAYSYQNIGPTEFQALVFEFKK